ncbi:Thymidylate kinase [Candidatus Methylopumilus planktonicus]|uniref:Thymidylate kinase n=1 Tax=Candidatus Methylopumilus planktonicus TaxID=1581557 RepID=A0A0D6EWM1_9PROT|nr:dTMP kinase [Candidatus Methylopumilus planktonicus]CEZ19678.1 Thymidylate kinase [Candidatus Methylopumilus planktonicus]
MTIKGKFITFEGVDGAGKSTHIDEVISFLESKNISVKRTREPGGTKLGEKLRELLLHDEMDPETETLLMFAARRQHIAEIIKPNLDEGIFVVSDRFTDATYAYQYGGKQVAYSKIQTLEAWVHPDLKADLTLLFDLPVEISIDRLKKNRTPDKFEKESEAFFNRLRNVYLDLARQHPNRYKIINANQSIETVSHDVIEAIKTIL